MSNKPISELKLSDIIKPADYCRKERPARKTFCQLEKEHKGSHSAVVFWEEEDENR